MTTQRPTAVLPMERIVATPSLGHGGRLRFAFDEDELTLIDDAVRAGNLAAGTSVAVSGWEPPAWWWQGTGLVPDDGASLHLRILRAAAGPVAVLSQRTVRVDAEAIAASALRAVRDLDKPAWQQLESAREGPDTEADFPLGAFVLSSRHEEVTAQRMRLAPATVATWTTIGPGAAPTEFTRLQQAVGAYHVVLVQGAEGARTVGIWSGPGAPRIGQAVRPVLRRLFRTQGQWRYGVKFAQLA